MGQRHSVVVFVNAAFVQHHADYSNALHLVLRCVSIQCRIEEIRCSELIVTTTDSEATAAAVKGVNEVTITVTSEEGTTGDYVIKGNNDAKLTALSFGNQVGANYPYTPTFSSDVSSYVTTGPLAGIKFVTATTSAPGATYAHKKNATNVEVTVTAPDGTTTQVYTITSSYSG